MSFENPNLKENQQNENDKNGGLDKNKKVISVAEEPKTREAEKDSDKASRRVKDVFEIEEIRQEILESEKAINALPNNISVQETVAKGADISTYNFAEVDERQKELELEAKNNSGIRGLINRLKNKFSGKERNDEGEKSELEKWAEKEEKQRKEAREKSEQEALQSEAVEKIKRYGIASGTASFIKEQIKKDYEK